MASALKNPHELSDSETEPSLSTNSKSSNSGLLPRKDNFRQCKGKNSKAPAKTHEATGSKMKTPIIDNGKDPEKSSQAEIIHDMNIKLNTLMALITNPDNEDHQDNDTLEDGELEEDGLVYFKSI